MIPDTYGGGDRIRTGIYLNNFNYLGPDLWAASGQHLIGTIRPRYRCALGFRESGGVPSRIKLAVNHGEDLGASVEAVLALHDDEPGQVKPVSDKRPTG